MGQGRWEGLTASLPSPGIPPSQHLSVFTNLEALKTPWFTVFLAVLLAMVILSSFSLGAWGGSGGGSAKSSNLLITQLVPLATGFPHPEAI